MRAASIRARATFIVQLLLLAWTGSSFGQLCPELEECSREFESLLDQFPSMDVCSEVCPFIESTRLCIDNSGCSFFFVNIQKARVNIVFNNYNCGDCTMIPSSTTPSPTATPSPSTPSPTPPSCLPPCPSSVSPVMENPIEDLGVPSIVPLPSSPECTAPEPDTLQRCSMFTYSHVWPFSAYRLGIQTCSVPGWWYLLNHEDFAVEVEATEEYICSPHTILSKVNITFFDQSCSDAKSYLADRFQPLSPTFSDGSTPADSTTSLQLSVNPAGTVVSLLAPWLNGSIVLHRDGNFLSITVQIPGRTIFNTDGLCNGGCPEHTLQDISSYTGLRQSQCSSSSNYSDVATILCFNYAGTNMFESSQPLYSQVCTYDLLRVQNTSLLSLLNATAEDALLLNDRGFVPHPDDPNAPTDGGLTFPPLTPSETQETEEPSQPTEEPSHPTEEPSQPTQEPSQPTEEPSHPTEEPSQPTQEPSQPTEEPSHPTEEPSQPTQEPSQPTEEPTQATMPREPVTTPDPTPPERTTATSSSVTLPNPNPTVPIASSAVSLHLLHLLTVCVTVLAASSLR